MRKSRAEVNDELGHLPIFSGEDDDASELLADSRAFRGESDAAGRELAARQRVELRKEQRSLQEQLSDWDDYDYDLDTEL